MCFAQGMVWTLILNGWRHWNRSAKFSGQSVGARIRRWWWGVNNWSIPDAKTKLKDTRLAKNVSEVSVAFLEVWHPSAMQSHKELKRILIMSTVLQDRILKCSSRLILLHQCNYTCMNRRSGAHLWNIRHGPLRISGCLLFHLNKPAPCTCLRKVPQSSPCCHFCLLLSTIVYYCLLLSFLGCRHLLLITCTLLQLPVFHQTSSSFHRSTANNNHRLLTFLNSTPHHELLSRLNLDLLWTDQAQHLHSKCNILLACRLSRRGRCAAQYLQVQGKYWKNKISRLCNR